PVADPRQRSSSREVPVGGSGEQAARQQLRPLSRKIIAGGHFAGQPAPVTGVREELPGGRRVRPCAAAGTSSFRRRQGPVPTGAFVIHALTGPRQGAHESWTARAG